MADTHELIYPIAQWSVTEDRLSLPLIPGDETVFALANGYLGVRGTFEEPSIAYAPGSFINGYYDTEPIVYGEAAYGFAVNRQRMIALPDATVMELSVNDFPLDLTTGTIHEYSRMLRMKTGVL